ncbi:MAG: holo-ACP synthase [Bacilli bacterium]
MVKRGSKLGISIGVDTELISRFSMEKIHLYANKFLSKDELDYYNKLSDSKKQKFIASRFSAKEAIFKALGTGIDKIKFSEITIIPNNRGKPIVYFDGYNIELSISYNDLYVICFVILKEN